MKVEAIGKQVVTLAVMQKQTSSVCEWPGRISLFQALAKADKMDRIVREATYLGVSVIIPMFTQRVIPRLKEERFSRRQERWQRIAAEAARLCGRAIVPEICPIINLEEALEWPAERRIFFWEKAGQLLQEPLGNFFEIAVYIGPEGGFSEEEVNLARKKEVSLRSLGPRILPVETAALVALTLVTYQLTFR